LGGSSNLIRPPAAQSCMQRYKKLKPKEREGELVEKDLEKLLVPRAGAQLGSRRKVRNFVGGQRLHGAEGSGGPGVICGRSGEGEVRGLR